MWSFSGNLPLYLSLPPPFAPTLPSLPLNLPPADTLLMQQYAFLLTIFYTHTWKKA